MKLPFFKFYPTDQMGDIRLRNCSYGARGLEIDLQSLCWMNEDNRGYLEVAGKPLTDPADIARLTSGAPTDVARFLAELEQANILMRDGRGCIFHPRLLKQARLSAARKDAGSRGGNPDLVNQRVNQIAKLSLTKTVASNNIASSTSNNQGKGGNQQPVELPPGLPPTGEAVIAACSATGSLDGNRSDAEKVYDAYPKHVDKPQAIRAITKALSKVPFKQLLAKTRAYSEHCKLTSKDPKYIPYPATWFNGERWNDTPEQVNRGSARVFDIADCL